MNVKRFFNVDPQDYIKFLVEHLEHNQAYERITNQLFFPQHGSTIEYLKSLEGSQFNYVFPTNSKPQLKMCDRQQLATIKWEYRHISSFKNDPYLFFSKKAFSNKEQAEMRVYSGNYFVFEPDFFQKVDRFFYSVFSDFVCIDEKKGIYRKILNDTTSIQLVQNEKYNSTTDVSQYLFPELSVSINGNDPKLILPSSDLRDFFFLGGNTFIFFHTERNNLIFGQHGGLVGLDPKKDEPHILCDVENEKIYVTNSISKLLVYNKYICISIDLLRQFYLVFESWVIEKAKSGDLSNEF